MGFHIFPHLFLICSLDRCQTTIPHTEKNKTKYKAFYLLWFCSETFPGAWLCSCPRRAWRPREEPAPGTDLPSAGFSQQGPEKGWPGHSLYLMEQLGVYENLMTRVGDYLLLASFCCQEASTNILVLLFQALQACTARNSPGQGGGGQREGNCLAKGHRPERARRKTSARHPQKAPVSWSSSLSSQGYLRVHPCKIC